MHLDTSTGEITGKKYHVKITNRYPSKTVGMRYLPFCASQTVETNNHYFLSMLETAMAKKNPSF